MKGLTKRQQRVYDYIKDFSQGHGYSPTYREIAAGLGFKSINSVKSHLELMIKKGLVEKPRYKSRVLILR